MNLLLHTIALEPARWTPARVSQDLENLLPCIAKAGFQTIEVFEPHLADSSRWKAIRKTMRRAGIDPRILSSYLTLHPDKLEDAEFRIEVEKVNQLVRTFGFQKVRLFPGAGLDPADRGRVVRFKARLEEAAGLLSRTGILLETHDGSLADDPQLLADIVRDLDLPNLGLLFQPTDLRNPPAMLEQFRIQKPHIRHVHLQNRRPDLSFARMAAGIVPWKEILPQLDTGIDATLEFVPAGITTPEAFDLEATLDQAREDADVVRALRRG